MQTRLEAQSEWGWKVAIYLFLAGVGAGAYLTGFVADLTSQRVLGDFVAIDRHWELASKIGIILGFPLVFIGSLFLIADLGIKLRALRTFMNPKTSWIARGTFIISGFMILGALHVAFWIWPFQLLAQDPGIRLTLGMVNTLFAILTMIYTGILLGASKPIAFWSTAILPLLFLVSAVSTGVMATILILLVQTLLSGLEPIRSLDQLVKLDMFLIILELIVLIFYLQAAHRTSESRASASLMLFGRYARIFWGGIVIIGLFIPLLCEFIEVTLSAQIPLSARVALGLIGALCGLFGGLLLRYAILVCGVKAPLRVSGIEFAVSPMLR
jgi:formate-dependent nitrite reductase membrane component NrfD